MGSEKSGIYGYGKQQREASVRLGLGADLSDLLKTLTPLSVNLSLWKVRRHDK